MCLFRPRQRTRKQRRSPRNPLPRRRKRKRKFPQSLRRRNPAVPDTQEVEATDDPHADEASEEPEATPTPVQPLENGFPTQLPEEKEEEQHEVAQ